MSFFTDKDPADCVIPNQPPNLSFTGPIHTIQFDHNGGTFQSPIHKVSLVVPSNALSYDEKVTVYLGATTSGPFIFPSNCRQRSAVVWLSVSPSDVMFKKNVSLIVPHSVGYAVNEHRHRMSFVICDKYENQSYRFIFPSKLFLINEHHGWIEMKKIFFMVAIVACLNFMESITSSLMKPFGNLNEGMFPPSCYLAKLFWPRGELPSSFKVDVYYIENIPTEIYKVTLCSAGQYYPK